MPSDEGSAAGAAALRRWRRLDKWALTEDRDHHLQFFTKASKNKKNANGKKVPVQK